MLVSQRSHGRSRGRLITFGVRERKDVKSWVEFIERTYNPEKIILAGISMGASTVLMASKLILSNKVKGIIADCGYTCPADIIKETIKALHLPVYPTFWFINFYSILFAGINLKKHSTINAIKNTQIPILFIHGTSDGFVPCRMSVENFEAKKENAKLLLIDGAYHAGAYVKDPSLYEKTVREFLGEGN